MSTLQAQNIVSFDAHCDIMYSSASVSFNTIMIPVRLKGSRGSFEVEFPTLIVPKTIVPAFKTEGNPPVPTNKIASSVFSFLNPLKNDAETNAILAKVDTFESDALRTLHQNRNLLPTECRIKQNNIDMFVDSGKHLTRRDNSAYPPSIGVKFNVLHDVPSIDDSFIDVHMDVDETLESGKVVRTMYKKTKAVKEGWKIQPVFRLGYIWISAMGGSGFGWFVSHFKLLNPVEVPKTIKYSNDDDNIEFAVSSQAFCSSVPQAVSQLSRPEFDGPPPLCDTDPSENDGSSCELTQPNAKRQRTM